MKIKDLFGGDKEPAVKVKAETKTKAKPTVKAKAETKAEPKVKGKAVKRAKKKRKSKKRF